jgi:hypothetical protein
MLSAAGLALLKETLGEWKSVIGPAYEGYHNHVHRMVTFCLALHPCTPEEEQKIATAACFHDIGLWVEDTLDYIPPSLPPAQAYLQARGLSHWSEEVGLMISEHHKLRAFTGDKSRQYPLVEVFRRGDLVDFSFGTVRFGLPQSLISEVQAQYPNAGFHAMLGRRAAAWFVRHPLNPAPMMKW